MARKKKNKSDSANKVLVIIASLLSIIAVGLSSLIAWHYFVHDDVDEKVLKQEKIIKEKKSIDLNKSKTIISQKPLPVLTSGLKEVLENQEKDTTLASHEYDDIKLEKPPIMVKREIKLSSVKPKLAIIIDDVSVKSHVRAIKALELPLTMSFLPPSSARPNSAKLASKEEFYMVHLPMEAQNFNKEEPFTLKVADTKKVIFKRITALKELFPNVKYINNHTGSKFTSDEIAMNRLISVLNDKQINFIDSRTTAQTKAPKVLKNFGLKYVARDVFLDHHNDKEYILNQIKKAIKLAKLHGTAIAIGHPHSNTLLALGESKKLFKDIELVYIDRLR
ncbi:MAG: divergent polysaccharide deacetylase family protein [Campylobacterota bacterium]|nr:divergent polysaccharide deacetylase family protein [Campylobacterota bacterium]